VSPHVYEAAGLVLLSALMIGVGAALMKLLLGRMSLVRLGFYRALFALAFNVPVLLMAREWEQYQLGGSSAALGLLNAALVLVSTVVYMKTMQAGNLSIVHPITQSYPLFALLFGAVLLGERVTVALLLGTLGILVGLCGLILGSPGGVHPGQAFASSVLWALACSLILGLLGITTKLALGWVPPLSLNLLANVGVLIGYVGLLLAQKVNPWKDIGWRDVGLSAVAGVMTLGLSGALYNLALQEIPAVVGSPLLSSSLLFSVLIGVKLFRERLTWIQVLSSLLVMGAVAAVALGQAAGW